MAILTREDSTNISLLLARPETEVRKWDRLARSASPGSRCWRTTSKRSPSICLRLLPAGNEFTWLGGRKEMYRSLSESKIILFIRDNKDWLL